MSTKTEDGLVIPTNSDELEAMLNDAAVLEALSKEGRLDELVTAYARHVHDKDEGIAQQIRDEVQKVTADMLRDGGTETDRVDISPNAVEALVYGKDRVTARNAGLYEPKALGAKLDGVVNSKAEFFQAIWHNNDKTPEFADLRSQFRNAFASDVPAQGGFLVPEEFRSELLSVALEDSIMRSGATVIPMGGPRVAIPTVDDTSHASSVMGGIVGYWTEEAATLTESQPSFARTVLDAKKLTAYVSVPNELLEDSAISFDALIGAMYPAALAFYEDTAFISGSGAGEPQGFTNANAYVSQAAESGQAATSIVWENIAKMYSRMLPSSLGRAVWIAHIDTFPELATMALSVGTGGAPVWLNNGAAGPPMTILGRPVIFTEKVATVGTLTDISFVDRSYYVIGDRQAMSAMSSEHVAFASDQTAYRIIERVDGRSWLNSAITPANGSNTLSAFVGLATRS